jgi:hypothetical protein
MVLMDRGKESGSWSSAEEEGMQKGLFGGDSLRGVAAHERVEKPLGRSRNVVRDAENALDDAFVQLFVHGAYPVTTERTHSYHETEKSHRAAHTESLLKPTCRLEALGTPPC